MDATRTMTINGAQFPVYDAGTGQTLLFLHGNSSRWQHWEPQLRAFSGRYRCVAPDLRGFGGTVAPQGTSLTQMADDVAALCAALGIARVAAIGLSRGGAVAEVLALRHPALVDAVVAAAPSTLPVPPGGPVPTREGLRAVLELSFSEPMRREQPQVIERLIEDCLATDLATLHGFATDDVADFDPARLTTPTLIVAGSADLLAPAAPLRALAEALLRGEFREIAGSGHWLNWEQPERFDALAEDFLRRYV